MTTWTTVLLPVDTARGLRWQGVCLVGEGYPRTVERLPAGAVVTYRTRLHVQSNEAREQARTRTIHHNVWHDAAARVAPMHLARYCPER